MTPERIAEIKARADAATPGLWIARGCGVYTDDYCNITLDSAEEDSRFIAASRIDVPDLIAALEAAQRERDEAEVRIAGKDFKIRHLHQDVKDAEKRVEKAERERDELRAAIERVRAVLDGAWSMATPIYAVRAALDPQPEVKQ